AKKVRFIDKVSRLAAAVRAGGKVDTRTDRTDSAQLSRRPLRKFPRHLEHEIAARRITRKEDFRQIVPLDQFVQDRPEVSRKARMAERWRQMFRPAAISLIHPQNVESGLERPLGNAQHVRRLARTLQAVHEHQGAMAAPPLLPVAFREKSRSRLD